MISFVPHRIFGHIERIQSMSVSYQIIAFETTTTKNTALHYVYTQFMRLTLDAYTLLMHTVRHTRRIVLVCNVRIRRMHLVRSYTYIAHIALIVTHAVDVAMTPIEGSPRHAANTYDIYGWYMKSISY